MKRMILIGSIVILGLSQTGCFSYIAMEHNKKQKLIRKVEASGDQAAIRAVRMGASGASIGVDVTALESLDSVRAVVYQLGGALLDAGLIYGIKTGVDSLNSGSSNSDRNNTLTVNTTGDGDVNININQSETTTITTTSSSTETQSSSTESSSDSSSNHHNQE